MDRCTSCWIFPRIDDQKAALDAKCKNGRICRECQPCFVSAEACIAHALTCQKGKDKEYLIDELLYAYHSEVFENSLKLNTQQVSLNYIELTFQFDHNSLSKLFPKAKFLAISKIDFAN